MENPHLSWQILTNLVANADTAPRPQKSTASVRLSEPPPQKKKKTYILSIIIILVVKGPLLLGGLL